MSESAASGGKSKEGGLDLASGPGEADTQPAHAALQQAREIAGHAASLEGLEGERDALVRQAERLARLVQVYDRAIQIWQEPERTEVSAPPVEVKGGDIGVEGGDIDDEAGQAPAPRRVSQPAVPPLNEPSIIVCMDEVELSAKQSVMPQPSVVPQQAVAPENASAARSAWRIPLSVDATMATLRVSPFVVTPRSKLAWMLGVGAALIWLTVLASRTVSLASSEGLQTPAPVKAATLLQPLVPLVAPPPPVEVPGVPSQADVDAQPGVDVSRVDVQWGDASLVRVRAALRAAIPKMRSCFAQAPFDTLALPKKLPVALRVHENGSISWVKSVSGGGSHAARTCIDDALMAARFPPSRSGALVKAELAFVPN